MRSPVVLLLHIGQSLQRDYATPVGGVAHSLVEGGFSGAYDEQGGLAAQYPTLNAFLRARVPEWSPGRPLVLACWSAGCWAPRAWMRNASDRRLVDALLLLDGLHSGFSPQQRCQRSVVQGIIDYGRLCADEPAKHLLAVTHSAIVPPGYASTTQCAAVLSEALPRSRAITIRGFPGDDAAAHLRQVREVGPALMRDFVATGGSGSAFPLALPHALAGLGIGVAAGWALHALRGH